MKRAFTLLEILVVIAIVTIISLIVMSVFGRVKASAMQTSCASNMRQIAMALTMWSAPI